MSSRRTRPLAALLGLTLTATIGTGLASVGAAAGGSADPSPPKTPTSVGYGGAVSSVDPYASQVGLDVLTRGGNAADAAVAMASALGVTEPFSAGVGGGGYFVYYDATSGKVLKEIEVGPVWSGPAVSRGRVYVATGNVLFSSSSEFSLFPHNPNGAIISLGLPGDDEVSRLGEGKE